MAAIVVTRKDLIVDMFNLKLTPTEPDFVNFCSAWIASRFPDADLSRRSNFVNNFARTTRSKYKKHRYTKTRLLTDNYFAAPIVFPPKPTAEEEPIVFSPSKLIDEKGPKQKGTKTLVTRYLGLKPQN